MDWGWQADCSELLLSPLRPREVLMSSRQKQEGGEAGSQNILKGAIDHIPRGSYL